MLKQDYHVHSQFSPDSESTLNDICQRAVELGLAEIVVTDHYEMAEGFSALCSTRNHYLELCGTIIEECRERWKDQLYLGFGIEIGQPHIQPEASRNILNHNPFDFVLASFHRVEHQDLYLYDYSQTDCDRLRESYVNGLIKIAKNEEYDCLAHLDLIKRYAGFQGLSLRMEECGEALEMILKCVIERGRGIEVNTSGLYNCLREPLPSLGILKLYRQLGGEIITVGSDAHRLQDIAGGFAEAEEIIKTAGFRYISRFHQRKCSFVKI